MTYELEDNIPMPEKKSKYPFKDMKVGQSFFAPDKNSNQMNNASSHWRKKLGWRFESMTVMENGVEGCRVWRVE